MDDITQLVKQLYNPAHTKDVVHIQKQLQDLQKSELGWQVADEFLKNADLDIRFFGALTLAVKINQDGQLLSEAELFELREKILSWVIRLAPYKEYGLVVRKLCNALVTYFALPNVDWRHILLHLALCLKSSQANLDEVPADQPLFLDTLRSLDHRNLLIVLTLADSLASDGLRIEHSGPRYHEVHSRIADNIESASTLIKHTFAERTEHEDAMNEAFEALETWIRYSQQEFAKGSEYYQHLQRTFEPALMLLDSSAAFENVAKFFIELFNEYSDFVTKELQGAFSIHVQSPGSVERLKLLEGDDIDEDTVAYGELVLSFCKHMAISMIETPEAHKVLIDAAHYLTKLKALRTEHNLSNAVADFWEHFALECQDYNTKDDSSDSDEPPVGHSAESVAFLAARRHCLDAVLELCTVIGHMPGDGDVSIDSSLLEARARATGLVQESLTFLQVPILGELVSFLLMSFDSISKMGTGTLSEDNASIWMAVEASLALIGSLSIEHRGTSSKASCAVDAALQALFSSVLFKNLLAVDNPIPRNIRKLVVRILGNFCGFTLQRADYVNFSLELLFQCLQEPDLMQTASRSIFRVCSHGRDHAKAHINGLIQATQRFSTSAVDEESKSNIIAATACTIQALGYVAVRDQVLHLSELISVIERDYQSQVEQHPKNYDKALEAATSALTYILKVAEASQVPDDDFIDLEEDDKNKQASLVFWQNEGRAFQQQIFRFIQGLLQEHSQDGQMLETACQILRAGYRERSGGPFAFPSSVTVELVTAVPISHSRVECTWACAANFVLTHLSPEFKDTEAVQALVQHAVSIVVQLDEPHLNPELSHNCMELFGRLPPTYIETMEVLPNPSLSAMLTFALKCLQMADYFPKKAASAFWTTIFSISQSQSHGTFISRICYEVGPALAKVISFAIGGQAARSELELYTTPLCKLVASQSGAKSWIEAGLFETGFPSNRVTDADKRKLVAQLMSLRGSKKTNTVVREFWTVSKGAPAGYN